MTGPRTRPGGSKVPPSGGPCSAPADLGYAVDFVLDATLTFPIASVDTPGAELGVDAIEERTRYALGRRFARIVDTRTLVAELAALGTPVPA